MEKSDYLKLDLAELVKQYFHRKDALENSRSSFGGFLDGYDLKTMEHAIKEKIGIK